MPKPGHRSATLDEETIALAHKVAHRDIPSLGDKLSIAKAIHYCVAKAAAVKVR
jgi:hypothetical protein